LKPEDDFNYDFDIICPRIYTRKTHVPNMPFRQCLLRYEMNKLFPDNGCKGCRVPMETLWLLAGG